MLDDQQAEIERLEEELERRKAEQERRRLAAAEKITELSASEVFARSVFIQRKQHKGWTLEQMADRLAEIGYPMHWTTVSKLEKLERKPKLEDLIAFSIALDVSPVHMLGGSFLPHGTVLKLTRSVAGLHPMYIRKWLRGKWALPEQDAQRYYSEVAPEEFMPPGMGFLSDRHKLGWLADTLSEAALAGDDWQMIREILRQIVEVTGPGEITRESVEKGGTA